MEKKTTRRAHTKLTDNICSDLTLIESFDHSTSLPTSIKNYETLAEEPGVARGRKKFEKKIFLKNLDFLA